jgi:hypothetical protein
MDSFEPSAFGPLGGILTLAVLFVLRELTSGVLKEAGKDLWGWAKCRRRADRMRPTAKCNQPRLRVVLRKQQDPPLPHDEAA